MRHFSEGLEEVLVVEERREIIENQIKQQLFNWRPTVRPRIVGKFDEQTGPISAASAALTVGAVGRAIAERCCNWTGRGAARSHRGQARNISPSASAGARSHVAPVCAHAVLLFRLPAQHLDPRAGRQPRRRPASAATYMVTWMDRNTETFTQMGGEGVPWTAIAPLHR